MTKLGISKWQENNLRILADYLLSGELKADFNMRTFTLFGNSAVFEITCGSIGCAVGHGPYAGIPKYHGEGFAFYSERVFGFNRMSHNWRWCFDYLWTYVDNTPEGAGKRILILLEEGLPEEWLGQMIKNKPLCY